MSGIFLYRFGLLYMAYIFFAWKKKGFFFFCADNRELSVILFFFFFAKAVTLVDPRNLSLVLFGNDSLLSIVSD